MFRAQAVPRHPSGCAADCAQASWRLASSASSASSSRCVALQLLTTCNFGVQGTDETKFHGYGVGFCCRKAALFFLYVRTQQVNLFRFPPQGLICVSVFGWLVYYFACPVLLGEYLCSLHFASCLALLAFLPACIFCSKTLSILVFANSLNLTRIFIAVVHCM